MPAYSFKERFVSWVIDGSKPGTIRGFRKYPVVVGMLAHLFFGMRTKWCRKLVEPAPVIHTVRCVLITTNRHLYFFETNWIAPQLREAILKGEGFNEAGTWRRVFDAQEMDEFAWRDGFRHLAEPLEKKGCFDLMYNWWTSTHGLPFLGNHILWGK